MGVQAYSNKPDIGGGVYQCTELAHRFMKQVYGLPTKIGMGLGNGDQLAEKMSLHFKNFILDHPQRKNKKARLAYLQNGCSGNAPVLGSLISLRYQQWGHVGIVREATLLDDKHLRITLFEQHGVMRLKTGQKTQRTQFIMTKDDSGKWFASNLIGWINIVEI